jgi:outer membrane protein assembly factor BamB/plastocyanin
VGTNNGWVIAANADTGEPVWATQIPKGGGINSTITVVDGVAYGAVSHTSPLASCETDCVGPYVVALDAITGSLLWASPRIDSQPGSDVYGSPVIHAGALMIGVSGGSAELGDETDRYAFQGSMVFLDTASGEVLKKTWTIHPPVAEGGAEDGYAGGAIWSTPAVDLASQVAYVGTGNPFQPQVEHANTNAVLAFDVNRASPSWGEIIGSYKGNVDEYFPEMSGLPCIYDIDGNPPPWYPQGLGACMDTDMDFGASPNLFTDPASGRLLVGTGQKSGVYHVFDAQTMEPAWSQIVGPPTAVGGIVGSTAFDGENVYGPVTVPGYVWSLETTGAPRWVSPTADGAHWGNPVASANGVIYTVDLKGFLDAYDAATGAPVLHRSMYLGSGINDEAVASWGGVSVARNTVYAAVGITGLPEGFVVAFRPSSAVSVPDAPEGPGLPAAPGGADAPAGFPAVAGPGAATVNYATPQIVIPQGSSITFTNADVPLHDFDSPDGAWPNTPLVGVGGSYDVAGIPDLGPGTYQFTCSLHPRMQGTLTVV